MNFDQLLNHIHNAGYQNENGKLQDDPLWQAFCQCIQTMRYPGEPDIDISVFISSNDEIMRKHFGTH